MCCFLRLKRKFFLLARSDDQLRYTIIVNLDNLENYILIANLRVFALFFGNISEQVGNKACDSVVFVVFFKLIAEQFEYIFGIGRSSGGLSYPFPRHTRPLCCPLSTRLYPQA